MKILHRKHSKLMVNSNNPTLPIGSEPMKRFANVLAVSKSSRDWQTGYSWMKAVQTGHKNDLAVFLIFGSLIWFKSIAINS